jgi:2-methylcitrate dehydratase PrpD
MIRYSPYEKIGPDAFSPTRELAKFIVNTQYDDIPRETIDNPIGMRMHILNALGVGLLGSTRGHGPKQLVEVLRRYGGPEEATLWGYPFKLPAISAAMANAMAVNSLEYDDHGTHPGCVVVPVALAMAEREGGVDGKAFINAVTIGFEVIDRISAAAGGLKGGEERGFYTSGTYNHFGAMAIAGKILGLNVDQMAECLGTGGCEAITLWTPSMTKRFAHSRAARTGIVCADLAKLGFTGTPTILEADKGGFFHCLIPPELGTYDLDKLTDGLGKDYLCTYAKIKMRASSGGNGNMDCLEEIMKNHPDVRKIDQIKKITLETTEIEKGIHLGVDWRNADPADTLREINVALMHEGFHLAVMLMDGELTYRQYTDERLQDPKTLDLIRKCQIVSLTPEHLQQHIHGALTIEMKNGGSYCTTAPPVKAYGSKSKPPTQEALYGKFRDCAAVPRGIDLKRANEIIDVVEHLENLRDVSDLAKRLATR